MLQIWQSLPRDILAIILKFDGRIIYKNGKYFDINLIAPNDMRYRILRPIILKKTDIMQYMERKNNEFYFAFNFDNIRDVGLAYDFNFSWHNKFEICYFDGRGSWIQIRTLL